MMGSRLLWGLMLLEALAALPLLFIRAALVNQCGSTSTCDFVCDCWDCSDENQCGYQKELGPLGTPLFTCDFEGTSCGWEDISTTAFRWSPTLASISTWGTKPPFDHTLGTDRGWYMSTTGQKVKPSATAQLRSPVMREAAATCEIRAWYHLSGTALNATHHPALSLELRFGNSTVTVWRSALTSSHPWRELVAYTGRIPGTFQVTFSATQNFSQTLQLALDDVEFRNCGRPRAQTCGPAERLCQQGGCVTPDRWCDGTDDCWDGEDEVSSDCTSFRACSFEEGWCGWEPLPNQTLSWINSSSLLGPPPHNWPARDHTTNSQAGFFVYLDHQLQGGKAWMVSPALRTSEDGSCTMVFYLHLRSSGSLNIYSRTEGTLKHLLSRSGDLGGYWFREKVDFHVAEMFQIVLEGTVIAGHPGSIALDDLILSPGCLVQSDNISALLPPDAPLGPCGQDEFACRDGTGCVGSKLVCDFKGDCADSSDEADCGSTTSANGAGGWTDLSVGRLQWTAQTASAQLRSAGISLALQEGPGQMLSLARAATPALGPSGLACVVEMDVTIVPQGFLALVVADASLGTHHWVWYALGNASAEWVHARVPLGARARPFQLELLGAEDLSSLGETPLLTVHNITFVDCGVNAPFPESAGPSCNFETDWCAWFAEQNGGFEWERSRGPGWGQDHTTSAGSFLFADPSAFGADGLSARLLSSPQTASGTHTCLSFWYRMEGPQVGTLRLLAQFPGEPEQLLWTQTGSSGSVWHPAFSTLSHRPGQSFQVIFEALRNGFLGTMALDDISVTPGSCGSQTRCSFEVDECGLLVKDGPAWAQQNGSRGSGPSVDHTLGTPQGHFFLLNTSGSALPAGRKATLRSGIFPPGRHVHCATFWYYLSSSGPVGSLHVYVEEAGGQRKVSTVRLTPGEAWHYANASIRVQEDWQVALVVEGGDEGPNSYLALDDLHVLEGACSEPGSCDFERSPCGWSKPPGAWYSWDWKEAATPSQSPSPKEDHTLGNEAGHYAYVDVALLGLGSEAARLASEPLPSTAGSCLRFHYHMDFAGQSSQAELRVKLSSLQGERTLWQATGHQSWAWQKQTLLVSSPTEFQIVLEATGGAWPSSETIAVDSISYAAELGCEEAPGTQGPEPGSGSGHRHSDAGLAASIVCFILLVVAAAAIATYCLKKRSAPGERLQTEHTTVEGFDNVTFQDDSVIIPTMPIDGQAE